MAKAKDKDTPVAPDPEIERVGSALALPDPEDGDPETDPAPAEESKKVPARKKKATTHVVTDWCGQLNHDGAKYHAGDGVNLTEAEAAALGKNVEPA